MKANNLAWFLSSASGVVYAFLFVSRTQHRACLEYIDSARATGTFAVTRSKQYKSSGRGARLSMYCIPRSEYDDVLVIDTATQQVISHGLKG